MMVRAAVEPHLERQKKMMMLSKNAEMKTLLWE